MKKNYQAPKVKAVKVQQSSIICGSFKTENLGRNEFDWGDDGGISTESLNRSVFEWED